MQKIVKKINKKLWAALLCASLLMSPSYAVFENKKAIKRDVYKITTRIEYTNQDFFARFSDPILESYLLEALKSNNSLRKTAWQVEEYRQNVKYSFGRELPSLNVGANYMGMHTPSVYNLSSASSNSFALPFVASYEADFLLKNRDKTRSAKKAFEAVEYEEKAINIALVSDVASIYTNILQYDKLIELQEELLAVKDKKLSIAQKSYKAGVAGVEYLNNSTKDYQGALQTLDSLKRDREQLLNGFTTMLGRPASAANELKRSSFDNFDYTYPVPESISSDTTFSRPDLMAVEAKLQKANFDIKVARKELFPTFNITGVWAFSTLTSGSFFSWESSLAALLAGATMDLFKGGAKIANLKINKARYEQMFEQYRQTELNALKEVNNALCIVKYDSDIDKSAQKKLDIQENNFKNANLKYTSGTISYADLLNEKEQLIALKQNKTQTKAARVVNYFTLYKAVGGVI